jgi:hypothetical protein
MSGALHIYSEGCIIHAHQLIPFEYLCKAAPFTLCMDGEAKRPRSKMLVALLASFNTLGIMLEKRTNPYHQEVNRNVTQLAQVIRFHTPHTF